MKMDINLVFVNAIEDLGVNHNVQRATEPTGISDI